MLIAQMHNEVLALIQRLDTNFNREIESPIIDIFLHQASMDILQSNYSPTSTEKNGQERLSELSPFLKSAIIDTFVAINANGDVERKYNNDDSLPTKYRIALPEDFMWLEDQEVRIFHNECADIDFSLTTNGSYTYSLLEKYDQMETIPNDGIEAYFPGFATPPIQITSGNAIGYPGWENYMFPDNGDLFYDHFIERANYVLNSHGYYFYDEVYKNLHFPGKIIIVNRNNTTGAASLDFLNGYEPDVYIRSSVSYITPTVDESTGNYTDIPLNIKPSSVLINSLANVFFKPNLDGLLGERVMKHINIYTEYDIVPTKCVVRYVRRPRRASLDFGISSEMPISSHNDIIAKAANNILATIRSGAYQMRKVESKEN